MFLVLKLFFRRHKRKIKRILLLLLPAVALAIFLFVSQILLPMFLFMQMGSIYIVNSEYINIDKNSYDYKTGGNVNGDGQSYLLKGGLKGMGIDIDATIENWQEVYRTETESAKKNAAATKIIYAQLIQILDAETELTAHPLLLYGSAMAIRETGTFSTGYSAYVDKIAGDYPEKGIYGMWYNKQVNGMPNNGGGVIAHGKTSSPNSDTSEIGSIPFTDKLNGGTVSIKPMFSNSSALKISNIRASDGSAITYNKGAFGPLQIEGNHWCSYLSPDLTEAYVNIPVENTSWDGKSSVQKMADGGYARAIVTPSCHYLVNYKANMTAVDTIMSTVGHQNYIQEFIDTISGPTGLATFANNKGYYFNKRFTNTLDRNKVWDDWVMSLEAYPHTFTLIGIHSTTTNYFFEGSVLELNSTSSLANKMTSRYGDEFNAGFKDDIARRIYWSLDLLQAWNYGNVCEAYAIDGKYATACKTAYFYRELANYIATNGTSELRQQDFFQNYNTGDNSNKDPAYAEMTKFIMKANGTDKDKAVVNGETVVIQDMLVEMFNNHSSSTSKSNYGYATTGIFDAETYMQAVMRDVFGVENFNIFNYGGGENGIEIINPVDGGGGGYDGGDYNGDYETSGSGFFLNRKYNQSNWSGALASYTGFGSNIPYFQIGTGYKITNVNGTDYLVEIQGAYWNAIQNGTDSTVASVGCFTFACSNAAMALKGQVHTIAEIGPIMDNKHATMAWNSTANKWASSRGAWEPVGQNPTYYGGIGSKYGVTMVNYSTGGKTGQQAYDKMREGGFVNTCYIIYGHKHNVLSSGDNHWLVCVGADNGYLYLLGNGSRSEKVAISSLGTNTITTIIKVTAN